MVRIQQNADGYWSGWDDGDTGELSFLLFYLSGKFHNIEFKSNKTKIRWVIPPMASHLIVKPTVPKIRSKVFYQCLSTLAASETTSLHAHYQPSFQGDSHVWREKTTAGHAPAPSPTSSAPYCLWLQPHWPSWCFSNMPSTPYLRAFAWSTLSAQLCLASSFASSRCLLKCYLLSDTIRGCSI